MKKETEKTKNETKNETKKSKWIWIILICLILIGIGGYFIFLSSDQNASQDETKETETSTNNEVKYNTNQDVISDKIVDNISFTNIECYFDGNSSLLEYTITNHSDKDVNLGEYEITIKDKDDNILAIIAPTLDYVLKPNESYDTGNAIDIDLSKAVKLELNLNTSE